MARKLVIAAACTCLASATLGCFGRGSGAKQAAREERQRKLLAGIYGTWRSQDGFVVVVLADRGGAIGGGSQISGIPGEINGRIMIKVPDPAVKLGKAPEGDKPPPKPGRADAGGGAPAGNWKHGVYKVVDRRLLARSTTEELWAVTFTCDLGSGKLFMPAPDGKRDIELFRSARPEVVTESEE
jgi:hypothetical protein